MVLSKSDYERSKTEPTNQQQTKTIYGLPKDDAPASLKYQATPQYLMNHFYPKLGC